MQKKKQNTNNNSLSFIDKFWLFKNIYIDDDYSALKNYFFNLPINISKEDVNVIYKGRNTLYAVTEKEFKMIIKSFQIPHIINRLVYGVLRSSKAKRSFELARLLRRLGIGTPLPIAYYTQRKGILFDKSYYACMVSKCENTYEKVFELSASDQERVMCKLARVTARLHENRILHKDYSKGNILFSVLEDGVIMDIIDLNRIRFCDIDIYKGCRNFERLRGTKAMFKILSKEYAKARGFDLIIKYATVL